ncbi:MAG: hypothetical protein ACO1SV_23720 [Fimbriimonas sp.]
MKKSNQVPAVLLMTVAAATMTGCNRPRYDYTTEVRRCVDPQGRIRPDYECERRTSGYYGGGYRTYPSWAYGGTLNNGRVMNFKSSATPGSQVVSPAGRVITRGGFGGSSSGRSGGFFGGLG